MKNRRIIMTMLLSFLIVLSAVPFSSSISASTESVPVINKTIYLNSEFTLYGGKFGKTYDYEVENAEYLDDDTYYSDGDDGYYFTVSGAKVTTDDKKPAVTVYEYKSDTKKVKYKKFVFTVKKAKKFKQKNLTVRKGGIKPIKIPDYTKSIKITYSKKGIAKFIRRYGYIKSPRVGYYLDSENDCSGIKGLKKGTTRITIWQKSPKIKLGSFKVKVKNIKPRIKKKYKTLKINMSSYDFAVAVEGVVENPLLKAKYTASVADKKEADTTWWSDDNHDEFFRVLPRKIGKIKVTVYETYKGKKRTVGTFILKAVKGKAADHVKWLIFITDDGICYMPKFKNNKCDLKEKIVDYYLSDYKSTDYKITYKSYYPDVLSVDKKGIVTRHKKSKNIMEHIFFTIKFKDGSQCTHFTYSY